MGRFETVELEAGSGELAEVLEVVCLQFEGELSGADLRAIAQLCFRSAQEDRARVVLDLSEVTHLDYRGVSALRAAHELLLRAGGGLRLAGASPYLRAILQAAGARGQLVHHATAQEATAALENESFGGPC